jgi:DNA-binding LacI/PurR family transcriptional regulator
MKHVAQAAGVSVMTVSLAMRHDPSIPATTRDRVLGIAAQLGYRRNPLVSVLMAGLRGWHPRGRDAQAIAYVESFPADAMTLQQAGTLARFRAGAKECAEKHGYRLQVFRMGEGGLSEARLEKMLGARGIRGVVFAPMPTLGSALLQPWNNHALATVGFSLAVPPLHRAMNHQIHSIRLAISELVAVGYRRIGLVVSRHEDGRVERNWLSSILLVQHENAGTDRTFPLFFEEKIERRELLRWLRQERPEVVLTTEQNIPAMLASASGEGMPRVGFAHMHLTPDLTGCSGIDQNNEQVGAAALYLVVEQLHGNSFGIPQNPKTVLIEGRWVPGTTAPGPGGVVTAR